MFFCALQREHAQDFDEVGVVDVDLDGAGVGDVDLGAADGAALGRLGGGGRGRLRRGRVSRGTPVGEWSGRMRTGRLNLPAPLLRRPGINRRRLTGAPTGARGPRRNSRPNVRCHRRRRYGCHSAQRHAAAAGAVRRTLLAPFSTAATIAWVL